MNIKSMSVLKLSRFMVGMFSGFGILLAALSLYLYMTAGQSQKAWQVYQNSSAPRVQAVNSLTSSLGYGGMIHQFKNYILRQDAGRIAKIRYAAGASLQTLDSLEMLGGDAAEMQAIADLRAMVFAYLKAVKLAEQLVEQGNSAYELDQQVKLSDSAALAGIELLFVRIKERDLAGKPTKGVYLGALRRAIGYGGMIHHFKNYVLR